MTLLLGVGAARRAGLRFASDAPPQKLPRGAATSTPAVAHAIDEPDRARHRDEKFSRWALASPDDAVARMLALPADARLAAAAEILTTLADQPDEAVRIAERFCREDRLFVREHGNTLIAVLTAAREHERAVAFAAAGGPERGDWLERAFRGWVDHAPAKAATAALAFEGDDATSAAFGAWAARDPLAVARFASQSSAPAAVTAAREALLAQLAALPD